jgi:hypothetical protein
MEDMDMEDKDDNRFIEDKEDTLTVDLNNDELEVSDV